MTLSNKKILYFVLCFFSIGAWAELPINIDENTRIEHVKKSFGEANKRVFFKEYNKNLDYLNPRRYIYIDIYEKNFGVVMKGYDVFSYRLFDNSIIELNLKDQYLSESVYLDDKNEAKVTIFGVYLGMHISKAEQMIYDLPTYLREEVKVDSNRYVYFFSDGAKLAILTNNEGEVAYVEYYV